MAKRLKSFMAIFFSSLLTAWLEDLFIFIGLAFIVYTTYTLNVTAGHYLVGFVFLLLGFIFAKK